MNTSKFESWAEDIHAYALENYESDGWDFIVECWTLDDIVEAISSCHSYDDALTEVGATAHALAEARDEVRAEIF